MLKKYQEKISPREILWSWVIYYEISINLPCKFLNKYFYNLEISEHT